MKHHLKGRSQLKEAREIALMIKKLRRNGFECTAFSKTKEKEASPRVCEQDYTSNTLGIAGTQILQPLSVTNSWSLILGADTSPRLEMRVWTPALLRV